MEWFGLAQEGVVDETNLVLLRAVERCDLREAQRIVEEEGADVNGYARLDEVTPLMAAAASAKSCADELVLPVMEYLIWRGADIGVATQFGETALSSSIVAEGAEAAKLLVERGADVNARIALSGATATILAAACEHPTILEYLVSEGADTNATDHFGNTPLIYAAWHGRVETTAYLMECGVNIHAADENGNAAFAAAAGSGRVEVAELLLAKGFQVNARNQRGQSALALAAERGKFEMAEYLLGQGANVNARQNDKSTALIHAAGGRTAEHADVIQLLLARGADANMANIAGHTARDIAAQVNNPASVRVFENVVQEGGSAI